MKILSVALASTIAVCSFAYASGGAESQNMIDLLKKAQCGPKYENGRPDGYECKQTPPATSASGSGGGIALKDNDELVDSSGKPLQEFSQKRNEIAARKVRRSRTENDDRSISIDVTKQTRPAEEMDYDGQGRSAE